MSCTIPTPHESRYRVTCYHEDAFVVVPRAVYDALRTVLSLADEVAYDVTRDRADALRVAELRLKWTIRESAKKRAKEVTP